MAAEDKRIDQLPAVTSLDLTSLMALQQGTNAKKVTLQQLLNYLNDNVDTQNVVLYVAQSLTEGQKLQARVNIGAAADGAGANAVLYGEQSLTEDQQHQARLNIRCGSVGEVADSCVASGYHSHAEGSYTTASGDHSHAEGYDATASGYRSHAEGYDTTASGYNSHAEGYATIASGYNSHAEGRRTRTSRQSQHVQGEYNIADIEGDSANVRGKYAHIVGNGTADDARSNAHTLDWDGVPWYAGDRVMLGGTGMDDENAIALMPVFVPQTLTEDQKLQARVNIGAAADGASAPMYVKAEVDYDGSNWSVTSVDKTYAEITAAMKAGAQVILYYTFTGFTAEPQYSFFYPALIVEGVSIAFVNDDLASGMAINIFADGRIGISQTNYVDQEYVDTSISSKVENALAQAKASGEFDGPAGPQGEPGTTPVKGVDYFTDADKQAIVSDVLAALPVWNGGSY